MNRQIFIFPKYSIINYYFSCPFVGTFIFLTFLKTVLHKMAIKGQIVEISAQAALYQKARELSASKKETLESKLHYLHYSLFDGFLVGEHAGSEHFKLGQRKGINVGGKKAPLYVIGIDEKQNRIFVGEGENHPGLMIQVLALSEEKIALPQDLLLSKEDLEQGVLIEVATANFNKETAKLYLFETTFYLEFEHSVSIVFATTELNLFYNNNNITNLKTTL